MQNIRIQYIFISLLCLSTVRVHAEIVYVTDELKIGLHEERTVDSPIITLVPSGTPLSVIKRDKIITLVPSGTPLSVIKRDNELIQVKDPKGVRGWINSKYVITEKPAKEHINKLKDINKDLQLEIESLKSKTLVTNGTDASQELAQKLKSERLKVGGLQAQLTKLKTRIANIDNSDSFLADIEQLKRENKQLVLQLESSGIEIQTEMISENRIFNYLGNLIKNTFTLLIVFVIGLVGGVFILDLLNRHRHGGFRV